MQKEVPNKRWKVVLTDDDEDDRELFESALIETGIDCDLTMFKNGRELVVFLENEQYHIPDIIFLDLNMPVLDGVNALLRLRAIKRCTTVPPVVIYSTSTNTVDMVKTYNSGANLFITKPTTYNDLKTILTTVLPNAESLLKAPMLFEEFRYQP